ncbi:MAG: dephospho-CoA kinase [Patescibacteria group bacterium]|nr:dephospho-CoA kinase [Patescibacteria group bacterium]
MSTTFIGFTGPLGCGKSTFIQIVESWGRKVFRADDIAKELLYQSGGKYDDKLAELLGTDIFTHDPASGKVNYNTKMIRHIIIHDESVRKRFWKFTADIVWSEIMKRTNNYDGFIYVESAILHEAGWNDGRFKHVVCIWCKRETTVERLLNNSRNGNDPLSRYEIQGLLDAQLSVDEKRARSDFCLYNGDDVRQEELPEYLRNLISFWDSTIFKTRPLYESEKNEQSSLA